MYKLLILNFLFLISVSCQAQKQAIPKGVDLVLDDKLDKAAFQKEDLGGSEVFRDGEGRAVIRLTTNQRPANIYNLSQRVPLRTRALAEGRVVLLSFEAKTERASLETGEGKLLCQLRQSDSYKHNLRKTASIGNEWRRYYFPYVLTKEVATEELKLALQFGYPEQEVLVRDLALLLQPEGTNPAALPRTRISYAGREADAPWRVAAARRIEQHRKGSFSLRVVDAAGNPRPDVAVSIRQQRHHFGWGAAVNARRLFDNPERLDLVAENFTTVVFENDLKVKAWKRGTHNDKTLAVMDELAARDVRAKGHVLIWPGRHHMSPDLQAAIGDAPRTERLVEDHLDDILKQTAGKVHHWDVVNEAYTNRDFQETTGSEEILYRGFRKLAAEYPEVGRFTNEFGIVNKGGHDETKQRWYYDYIKRIDENTGGLVDGIGLQCHMGSDLTPPARVLELLDYYGGLDKKIAISEFTIDLDDDELRFDYTRDFLTLAFSHPAVSEFLFWGFDATTHPKAALFSAGGEPAAMGSAFRALVHDAWLTIMTAPTDAGGRVQGRGFFGTYEYHYELDGHIYTGNFELVPGEVLIADL